MEGSRAAVVARHSRYAVCRRWRPGSRARCAPLGGRGLWGQEDGILYRTIRHQISRSGMLFSCSVLYRATFSRHLFGQSQKTNSANFAITEFSEVRRTRREVWFRDSRILHYVKLQSERV